MPDKWDTLLYIMDRVTIAMFILKKILQYTIGGIIMWMAFAFTLGFNPGTEGLAMMMCIIVSNLFWGGRFILNYWESKNLDVWGGI